MRQPARKHLTFCSHYRWLQRKGSYHLVYCAALRMGSDVTKPLQTVTRPRAPILSHPTNPTDPTDPTDPEPSRASPSVPERPRASPSRCASKTPCFCGFHRKNGSFCSISRFVRHGRRGSPERVCRHLLAGSRHRPRSVSPDRLFCQDRYITVT